jgi:DNA-binding HxlR family transcriptional regulator
MESSEKLLVELVTFFKALSDENRLKIIGVLAQRALSTEQLAVVLDLMPATISHHLSKLAEVGLVRAHTESYYKVYELQTDTLHTMARRLLAEESLPGIAANVDVGAYDRKVIVNFTRRDGRLKEIPAQRKKREAVLRHILEEFRSGKHYSEKQVNDIIGRFHEDTATLRRELIGYGWLKREGGVYWRVE